jgi:hypothetical protein
MNMKKMSFVFLGAVLALSWTAAGSDLVGISGDYLEARTADVYTGPCFANGEVNLTGKEAIMAWRIREGSFSGVALDGLLVVAVVKAQATLGDPHANPLPARAVLLVDERGSAEQREALVGFARRMGGDLVANVIRVEPAPIAAEFDGTRGYARLTAGERVNLSTRAIQIGDKHCGNEYLYYPPLTSVDDAVPAYTLAHAYRGTELNTTWSCPSQRSAYIGTFSR